MQHHRGEGRLLARHRARPVPGRRLGPELRPALGVEASRADARCRARTMVTADVPPRRDRRALAPGRVPPDRHRRAGLAGAPRLDVAVPRQPARPASPTTCSPRSRTPTTAMLESVTLDDLEADVGRHRAAEQLLGRARDFAAGRHRGRAPRPTTRRSRSMNGVPASRRSSYDQTVDLGTTADALDKFLFETHRGFCEQYAAAFAELARSIGLPTRVAVGYQPGQLDARRAVARRRRRTRTPGPRSGSGRRSAGTGSSRRPAAPTRSPASAARPRPAPADRRRPRRPPTTAQRARRRPRRRRPTPVAEPGQLPTTPAGRRTSHTARPRRSPRRLVALAVARRRVRAVLARARDRARGGAPRRRRHDPDARRRVLGAWTEALERLAAAGIERRPSTTSLEFALRQAPALGAGAAGPAAHGPRATAHRRDVRARPAVAGRSRRGVDGGRRDLRRAALDACRGPGAGARGGARRRPRLRPRETPRRDDAETPLSA